MKILFATGVSLEIPDNSVVDVNLNGIHLHEAILENKDIHQKLQLRQSFPILQLLLRGDHSVL